MKYLSLLCGSLLFIANPLHAQVVSHLPIHISEGALVSFHMPVVNENKVQNHGEVHFAHGLTNRGVWEESGTLRFQGDTKQMVKGTLHAKTLEVAGDVQFQEPVRVDRSLVFSQGIVEGHVIFGSDATSERASHQGHVAGRVTKENLQDFNFPLGTGSELHSVRLSEGNGSLFSVHYIPQSPIQLSNDIQVSLTEINAHDYWVVQSPDPKAAAQVRWETGDASVAILSRGVWQPTDQGSLRGAMGLAPGVPFTSGKTREIKPTIGIWPNPTSGEFQLRLTDFPDHADIRVEVITLEGRKIMESQGTVNHLRATYRLPEGLITSQLTVRVLHGESWWTEKLIFQP